MENELRPSLAEKELQLFVAIIFFTVILPQLSLVEGVIIIAVIIKLFSNR